MVMRYLSNSWSAIRKGRSFIVSSYNKPPTLYYLAALNKLFLVRLLLPGYVRLFFFLSSLSFFLAPNLPEFLFLFCYSYLASSWSNIDASFLCFSPLS